MADIELVIKIPEDTFKRTVFYREFRDLNDCVTTIKALEKAVPLPKSLMECIKILPSVTPQEPKTGHWKTARTFPTKLYDEYLNEYECSECKRRIRCTESQLVNYPYCHCGANMLPTESEGNNAR